MTGLLEIRDLTLDFETQDGAANVLDHVSLSIEEGEAFGLVGETGCGKTVTALAILRLLPKTARIRGGEIRLEGENLLAKSEEEMNQRIRGRRISMIFQNPATSLNPLFTVGRQVVDVIQEHEGTGSQVAQRRVLDLFRRVGLPDPERVFRSYPHELSGGMQQRVMISMALSCQPRLLIADEPTTAVDVTIQAQILELLSQLKTDLNLGVLLITHNLGIVAELCDGVGIMYAGTIAEIAETRALFREPRHPYTQALLKALPSAGSRGTRLKSIPGTIPSLFAPPSGCRYHPRCDFAMATCTGRRPELLDHGGRHWAACLLYEGVTE